MRTSAYIVDRLLRGETPADIPITDAPLFLGINVEAAGEIGMTIPETVMARVTQIPD
jgi:ABC-type uncharacterized transport system substrate-binding protein